MAQVVDQQKLDALSELLDELEDPRMQRMVRIPEPPDSFLLAAVAAICARPVSRGTRRLVAGLSRDRRFLHLLVNPQAVRTADAERVARSSGPGFEDELERELSQILENSATADDDRLLRLLTLFDAAGAERRCVWYQTELMASPNLLIRSKSAKLFTRGSRRAVTAAKLLLDTDPRVQASAIESLWGCQDSDVLGVLKEAAKSPHARVMANAAVGLHMVDQPSALTLIRTMARHPEVRFRSSAVWVMGEIGDLRFIPDLARQLDDRQGVPRVSILRSLSRLRNRERVINAAGEAELVITEAVQDGDGRILRLALRSATPAPIRALEFSVRENDWPVDDYTLTPQANPAVVVAGFILPPRTSTLGISASQMLEKSRRFQRAGDLWETTHFREDDHVALAAVDRMAEVISRHPGTRHLVLLLANMQNKPSPKLVEQLSARLLRSKISLEVILPPGRDCRLLEQALPQLPSTRITHAELSEMPRMLERSCARLASLYELRYRSTGESDTAQISFHGSAGTARIDVAFAAPEAARAAAAGGRKSRA